MKTNEHTLFRRSKEWKQFRADKLKEVNCTCELCGTVRRKGKGLHIHHLFPTDYKWLNPALFRVVCPACHKYIIERFAIKKSWGKLEHYWLLILNGFMEIKTRKEALKRCVVDCYVPEYGKIINVDKI
jgi:hypothetical protein